MYDFKIFCSWLWCLPMLYRTCICFWGHLDTVLVPWVLLERQWHQRFRGKGTLSLVASNFSLWLDASVDAICRLGGVQNPLPNQKLLMQVLKASPSNLVANTASMLQMISDGCFASTKSFPSYPNRILTYSHSRGVSSQAVYLAWTWALLHLHIMFKQVLLIQLLQFWGHGSCWQWCLRKHQLGRIPGIHSAHPGGGDARSNEAPSIVVMHAVFVFLLRSKYRMISPFVRALHFFCKPMQEDVLKALRKKQLQVGILQRIIVKMWFNVCHVRCPVTVMMS